MPNMNISQPLREGAYIVLLIFIMLASASISAMPAAPFPFSEVQPDGTEIMLHVRGDEHFSWMEDTNGYTVIKNNGWFEYAELGPSGHLLPNGLIVGRENPQALGLQMHVLPSETVRSEGIMRVKGVHTSEGVTDRSQSIAPAGIVKNLVVMIRFSDHVGRTLPSVADIDVLFNTVGGDPLLAPTGSIKDVYYENSYGQMTLSSFVNPNIGDWITVSNTEAYYANGDSGDSTLWEALREALNTLDAVIDFNDYDSDNDNRIDSIAFIHSGYAAEWGGTDAFGTPQASRIWSHRWAIQPQWNSNDGVSVYDYHISPGVWGTSGSAIGRIGVIAHETGHFFGLPDLYDTDSPAGNGIGSWGLMANSWGFDGTQHCPPHFSPWSKIRLGWSTPMVITQQGQYTINQAETNAEVYRINTGFPSDEYLLIENRQNAGFDCSIPQGGIAIWHIDDATGYSTQGYPEQIGWPGNGNHYRVALLQADGNYDLEKDNNRGDSTDMHHIAGVDAIGSGPGNHPNTDTYQNGTITQTGIMISDISASDTSMSFCFNDCNDVPSWNMTTTKSGTGTGTVTSSPAGIDCGADCSESYNDGTHVDLTATASAGSRFVGWSGSCSGVNPVVGGTMNADKSCNAQFDSDVVGPWNLSIGKAGFGAGTVTGPGIDCGLDCSQTFSDGEVVELIATTDANYYFQGWFGACSGNSPSTTVTMNSPKTCTAEFGIGLLTITKSGTGTGTVTSSPAGIDCGVDCTESFNDGTHVDLTATASAGSHFVGWSGSCSGSSPSTTITMNGRQTCNAEFGMVIPGEKQEVYANPSLVAAQPGGDVGIDVMYNVSDADATLTGIGFRVHYDSTMLSFDQMDFTLANGRLFDPTLVVSEADSSDFDGDASTDRFISLAWVDFGGNWPGSLPQHLASPHFIASAGFSGSTQVNFSSSALAAGYTLAATSATVFEQPCTLDTDGNGADSALTDGVLDVRYLFGFSGAQLTDGAIGPGATRPDAASIISYLDGCPTMLDPDGNGSAGALTDGVLIVRYLFGFTGAQLTDGAVGPGCTRCDAGSIISFLNSHDTTSTPASQQLVAAGSVSAGNVSAGEQVITSQVNRSSAGRDGKTVDVLVDYMTTQRSLTGLGLRMHFDSSKLSLVELSDIFPAGALQHQLQEDTLDFDGDPKTDRYINIAWMDYMGSWPGTDQTQLFTATFQMAKGQGSGATTIRYSVADVAAGMDVYLEPVGIGPGNSTKAR